MNMNILPSRNTKKYDVAQRHVFSMSLIGLKPKGAKLLQRASGARPKYSPARVRRNNPDN